MNKLPISFETILLFITLTGLLFVPESRIPLLVWPLIAGIGNLAYVALRTVQNHTFRDEDFRAFHGGRLLPCTRHWDALRSKEKRRFLSDSPDRSPDCRDLVGSLEGFKTIAELIRRKYQDKE